MANNTGKDVLKVEANKRILKNPDGAGPFFENDIDFDCEEAWGWNHANPGYFRE
ncbi:MAG: hypothetical protein LBH98_05040 [Chitinispirillales bacterium]|jgi:hypothetical protein|nr:hypothetical protein [Chitinispirillales bacterium]